MDLQAMKLSFPGLSTHIALGVYVLRKATEKNQSRVFGKSDYGDLLHAYYAPYMDIYRTDRFMSDALKKILASRKTRVASTLFELPELIENCLFEESAN